MLQHINTLTRLADELKREEIALDFAVRVEIERALFLTAKQISRLHGGIDLRSLTDIGHAVSVSAAGSDRSSPQMALQLAREVRAILSKVMSGSHYEYWDLATDRSGRNSVVVTLAEQIALYARFIAELTPG